jgi:amino acid transporter
MLRKKSAVLKKPGDTKRQSYLVLSMVILVLSLLTWSYFYYESMPLSPRDTSFVVGVWFLVVLAIKIVGQKIRDHILKKRHKR